ncbi:MAG: hypothetical protein ABIN91_02590 [Mucilaginibacter sp.]|uniref:hypothetical protein n=1 Tax=Mucilaginibacter sp. TaxID=1882438 RepID=UPI003265D0FF
MFRLFEQQSSDPQGCWSRPSPAGFRKKISTPRCAQVVFFFQKPCPASLLYQERLLNKKPEKALAEGYWKEKRRKQMEAVKNKSPPDAGRKPKRVLRHKSSLKFNSNKNSLKN